MSTRGRRITSRRVLILIGGVIAVISGWFGLRLLLPATELQQPNIDQAGWTQFQAPETVAGVSYAFAGATTVCVEGGDDPARITNVELLNPVGPISVVAYSVAENVDAFPAASEGFTKGTLKDIGWPTSSPVQVRSECPQESSPAAIPEVLGVELRKATNASAGAAGLKIHWASGRRSGVVTYPYAIVLCEHTETDCPNLLPREQARK